ncbi:hypothetical protein GM658_23360 [Pseudoduganella eburnea]|uniref:Uncharacterized protein n=1 Tax=Massilia eburnea TaxID=1776165 RepID=A0A6L6QPU1_9BURK|nr:hypothetical protein [Massilia eburnea]
MSHSSALTLPSWPESTRGIPNIVLRSALCAAIGKGKRVYFERELLASYKNFSILYTGQQLDQGDLSVWLMILHYARLQRARAGEAFRFTAYSMLTALRKTDTGGNRAVLHRRLLRLKANSVEIVHDHRSYVGSLLAFFERDQGTGEYVVVLDPQLVPFFGQDQFTRLNWEVRLDLEGKPLAQWVFAFYESHAVPYKMQVTSLLRLSGSKNSNCRSATQKLNRVCVC